MSRARPSVARASAALIQARAGTGAANPISRDEIECFVLAAIIETRPLPLCSRFMLEHAVKNLLQDPAEQLVGEAIEKLKRLGLIEIHTHGLIKPTQLCMGRPSTIV